MTINLLGILLILAADADAQQATSNELRPAAAKPSAAALAPLYQCGFEPELDTDFDGWPDGWSRRRGPGYPHYVKIEIGKEPSPEGEHCLRIDKDGGAAAVFSPPIEIDPHYAFLLEASVKTPGLVRDTAFVTLTFLGPQRKTLQTFTSEKLPGNREWTVFRIGPEYCRIPGASWVVIGLHVEPTAAPDLRGSAMFDALRLVQTPRAILRTANPFNLLSTGDPVVIECDVSGLPAGVDKIELQVDDAEGARLAATELALTKGSTRASAAAAQRGAAPATSTSWQPPIVGPGYYRVRVKLLNYDGPLYDYELGFAIVEPLRQGVAGEFGWTLPGGEGPLTLIALAQLAGESSVRWLKFPLWNDGDDPKRVEKLIDFADRLSTREIALVGLLADPPAEVCKQIGASPPVDAATLLSADPKKWYPALEPVMARMALKVRWWQLGGDGDSSLGDEPDAAALVDRAKRELDRIGRDVKVGMAWGWLDEPPPGGAWRFLARTADPPLTADELSEYLPVAVQGGTPQWITLEPLAKDHYASQQRVADLVQRMLVAKVQGAAAIFADDPLDGRHGLVNDDGTVAELFLPWRQTAAALAGASYAGELVLPGVSRNLLFFRGDEPLLVVWNDKPTREVLYLGNELTQTDVWGRHTHPVKEGANDVLQVDRLPTFVTGLNAEVARWRMALAVGKPKLPSVFGQPHAESLKLKNFFDRGVSGSVRLHMPQGWRTTPDRFPLKLAAGEEIELPLEVMLPFTTSTGRQGVRIDFDITADHRYQFSVYRTIQVGMDDVEIEATTQENADGDLEIQQEFVNHSDQAVSFRCELYAPQRRRLRWDVMNLSAGREAKVYVLRNAKDLIGETLWIRAEEIGGARVLNYRFVAQP